MIKIDKNYYRILQVDPLAESEVITVAYLALKQKYLLDNNGSEEIQKKLNALEEAYLVLGDVRKRARYNEILWDE